MTDFEVQEFDVQEFDVQQAAYALWEREGRPDGRSVSHWLEAERLVREARQGADLDEGLVETFPASDPPASLMRASKAA